jgi:integrase
LNRSILPALRKAGCEWHGWHAFRRGLGSNLAELGVEDLTIQRILRHASVGVTRQHYIKVRDAKVNAAMELLEAALCANCAPASAPGTAAVVN